MEEKKELSFEEALNNLENAVNKLSSGEIKLDEAFKTFEDGIAFAKICEEKLTSIEAKVAKIIKDNEESEFKVEKED